jgi:murein DD-endopeptidase MepM/ murein hydrolase activator NlpD
MFLKNKKLKLNTFSSIVFTLALLFYPFFSQADSSNAAQQLQQQLDQINQQVSNLQGQIDSQEKQTASLQNEITLYNNQIQQTQLQIQAAQTQISGVNLQIGDVNTQITDRTNQIEQEKQVIAQLIVSMSEADNNSGIQLELGSGSFSGFLDQIEYNNKVQQQISDLITQVEALKVKLQNDEQMLQNNLDQLNQYNQQLNATQQVLSSEKNSKQLLLTQTKGKESQYKKLLASSQGQQNDLEQEIYNLDKQAGSAVSNKMPVIHGIFSWPVQGVITQGYGNTGFTALGYSFHNGIDIAGPAGAPISAAADGVVLNTGTGSTAYGNWVTIKHTISAVGGHQIITLYGHMISYIVSVGQTVKKGELIGFEGNTGDTTRLLYGPEHGYHLHFTVFDAVGYKVTPGAYPNKYGPYQIPNGYTYDPNNFL